ncbi:MAG TPA: triose-phosphate isomerase [Gemmataceae bacterium]|jgi:triosephosphate isomerase|nr:triose-phosphate isomerase [Gemmataceae bacterium]
MRTPFVAGNWKMYTTAASARDLAAAVVRGLGADDRVSVALCPPFPYLAGVADVLHGSRVLLGAQNLYPEKEGAFTGEVSPAMLVDVGCRCVIVGHSERRHLLGETDAFINRKVRAALAAGLVVILCVGETLDEREANRTEKVLDVQLSAGLAGLDGGLMARVVIAYEPVWAIGTGRNATPEQAQQAHAFIRGRVGTICGEKIARAVLIQYGGSVKRENAAALLGQPDVDGALVGGASLKADQFLAIVAAASSGQGPVK